MGIVAGLTKFAGRGREEVTAIASYRNTTILSVARIVGFFGDFGVPGQFSTDIIGKFLMGKTRNEDMKKKLYWLLGMESDDETPPEQVGAELVRISHDFIKSVCFSF